MEESLRIHKPEMDGEARKERALDAARGGASEPERIYASYPHQLSGGQRQRVMIAAAMICSPSLLIADEPTTALDVTVQLSIVKLLAKLSREQRTAILFISHDLSLVKRLCGRIVVMKDGRVVEEGSTEQIYAHPRDEYTRRLIASIPGSTKKQIRKERKARNETKGKNPLPGRPSQSCFCRITFWRWRISRFL